MNITDGIIADRLAEHIDLAHLVAWDECHKIYLAMDEAQADFFRAEYPVIVEGAPDAMAKAVITWWNDSCGLRFISAVHTNAADPNAGFVSVVDQFEDDDEDDEL